MENTNNDKNVQSQNHEKKSWDNTKKPQNYFQRELKKYVELNEKMHNRRLKPFIKESQEAIRVIPLGGLNEIGGNMTIIETQEAAIIIDAGISFPDSSMCGVDVLIPNFGYLDVIANKLQALIITHAHEDHIGAVPYLIKKIKIPIYGTPLPISLISNKFDEHGLRQHRNLFKIVEKRRPMRIGEFEIEWLHITHSIVDCSALGIKTKAGTIVHTGDFKIDHTPIDNYPTDLSRFAYYGEKGVLLLLSDSTNSHKKGYTGSEALVGNTFDRIFSKSQGRLIMSTFSSNIHRVYQAISTGLKYGRKVCVVGRSMEKNMFSAIELGYIKLPTNIFIDADEINNYKESEVLIVTTGSQGEGMSALYKMAANEHRHIKLTPNDTVVLSASPVPGNESSVSKLINLILKNGSKIAYQNYSDIHVSGHCSQEEQKLLLRLVRPKYFLPVHGEYNHVHRHKQTAISCGVNPNNILLMQDGSVIEVCSSYMKKVGSVKTGKVFVDNYINKELSDDIIFDRQRLAYAGMVVVHLNISQTTLKLAKKPYVNTMGIIGNKHNKQFAKNLEDVIDLFLTNVKQDMLSSKRRFEDTIKNTIRKQMFKKYKKYPCIILNVELS